MSPEQALGKPVDLRSDIFSFGILLYELLSGTHPFRAEYDAAVIYAIVHTQPPPLSENCDGAQPVLQAIIEKALAKDPKDRYQSTDEMLLEVQAFAKGLGSVSSNVGRVPQRSRFTSRSLIRMAAFTGILATVAFIAASRPWNKLTGTPAAEAGPAIDRLAVLAFDNIENRADTDRLGEIISNLIITDLVDSRFVQVTSDQQLADIAHTLEASGELKAGAAVGHELAIDIAKRARATRLLVGSILQTEPRIVLTTQLLDVNSGEVIHASRFDGNENENVFALVDRLTVKIRQDLDLPAAALAEKDRPVADLTTSSAEAYRYYIEGIRLWHQYRSGEGAQQLQRAIEIDSTFAMAYVSLASLRNQANLSSREYILKAAQYADRTTEMEQMFIRSQVAYLSGNPEGCVKALKELVARYPNERLAWEYLGITSLEMGRTEESIQYLNRAAELNPTAGIIFSDLAYAYWQVDDFEHAIRASDQYITLEPQNPNAYDTRGDIYAFTGMYDRAAEAYRRVLELDPKFRPEVTTAVKLGDMQMLQLNFAQAESCYVYAMSSEDPSNRSQARFALANCMVFQGRLDSAIQLLNAGLVLDSVDQTSWVETANKHLLKAWIYLCKHDLAQARQSAELGRRAAERVTSMTGLLAHRSQSAEIPRFYCQLLIDGGWTEEARQLVSQWTADLTAQGQDSLFGLLTCQAQIAFTDHRLQEATEAFRRGMKVALVRKYLPEYFVAKAGLESGDLGSAVETLETSLKGYTLLPLEFATWRLRSEYLLGIAYEQSGWKQKAISQYTKLASIYAHADSGIAEAADVKARLAKLRS